MGSPGPLALVGGDELRPGNEPIDRLLIGAAREGPAYVLATAAGRHRPDVAVANAVDWFAGLGLDVSELPAVTEADVRSSEHAAIARDGRFFYLVGGDPDLVPSTLAGSPVWDAIVQAWRDGASLAGASAGAMGMAEWALLPRGRGRAFVPALDLVPSVAVLPHFDTFGKGWLEGAVAASPPGAVLLGPDERTGAVWHDGGWHALGRGSVTVVTGGEPARFAAGDDVHGLPAPRVA
jgi:cyanophycinase